MACLGANACIIKDIYETNDAFNARGEAHARPVLILCYDYVCIPDLLSKCSYCWPSNIFIVALQVEQLPAAVPPCSPAR